MSSNLFAASLFSIVAMAAVNSAHAEPVAAPAAAAKKSDAKPVDISKLKAQIEVFSDDDGNIYAVKKDPFDQRAVYFGDGKTMYEQLIVGGSSDGGAGTWDMSIWAPRASSGRNAIVGRDYKHQLYVQCTGSSAEMAMHEVAKAEATRILDTAQFFPRFWHRHVRLLARDDTGVYFLADQLDSDEGDPGVGYRFFMGKRGAMKELALTNIVDDDAGLIFASPKGELRLVKGSDKNVYWVHGSKRTQLVDLDLQNNRRLIYRDLGVYSFLGTVCENQ